MSQNLDQFGTFPIKIVWAFKEWPSWQNIAQSGACTIKNYRFVIYGYRSKLVHFFKAVCLSKLVKVTDNRKDTSLLQNMSILHKLRTCNFL